MEWAERNQRVHASAEPFAWQLWGLDKIEAPAAWPQTHGDGVTVAVVDSGADLDHPDLEDQLVPGEDFVDPETPPDDEHWHGTHVTGTIVAQRTASGSWAWRPRRRPCRCARSTTTATARPPTSPRPSTMPPMPASASSTHRSVTDHRRGSCGKRSRPRREPSSSSPQATRAALRPSTRAPTPRRMCSASAPRTNPTHRWVALELRRDERRPVRTGRRHQVDVSGRLRVG